MFTIPNIISLSRLPLALVFLQENLFYRIAALILAMCSDVLDGYFARRYCLVSRLGTLIDPLSDKLFVIFVLGILTRENNSLTVTQIASFFCRDMAVVIYGSYLVLTDKLSRHCFRSIWCGKLTTFFQFIVLITYSLGVAIPSEIFAIFIILGILALFELYLYVPASYEIKKPSKYNLS